MSNTYAETVAAMESNTVCRCNGTGAVGHEYQDTGPPRPIGDGLTIGPARGYTTELCPCRRSLPRRYGEASWWSKETVHADSIDMDGLHDLGIEVSTELPISKDNYPLHRTERNMRFRVLANLDADDARMMTSDNVRELAAWLIKTADCMDQLDAPYPEETP